MLRPIECEKIGLLNFSNRYYLAAYIIRTLGSSYHFCNSYRFSREIIDTTADQIELQDPMYKYWLKKKYFRNL